MAFPTPCFCASATVPSHYLLAITAITTITTITPLTTITPITTIISITTITPFTANHYNFK
ncbi:hypothetical protein C2G38_2077115, partial [Gigaspora rosea]